MRRRRVGDVMLIEHGVLVPGELAARYGVAIERLVVAQLRRDRAAMPPDLDELLGGLVAAGRRWREANQIRAERNGTCGIPLNGDTAMLSVVETINTEEAAARLRISPRAVRARASRGSVPARRGMRGGWVFDVLDIEELVNQREDTMTKPNTGTVAAEVR